MRVGPMVRHMVLGCSDVMHAKRLAAVVKAVEGIVRGACLSPATIGRNLEGRGRPKHGIKCVDRLLGNPHLQREHRRLFAAMAHYLLRGAPHPVVLIDWTQAAGRKHQALVAAVPIGGRALPIYLEVHPLKKLGNVKVERLFLRVLSEVLPSGCVPVVVSDAGFKGPFFKDVRARGWNFVGRVRGTSKAVPSDGEGPVLSKQQLYAMASTTPRHLGQFGLFVKQQIPCGLVLVRKRRKPGPKPPPPKNKEEREMRRAALDPWLLATSLTDGTAAYIVNLYAKRMQIEETFRDAKNHRFGWALCNVRIACANRAATLLLLATLAILVVTLIGMAAERNGLHPAYQANTSRRRVLSFFVLACTILHRGRDRISRADFALSVASIAGLANA
jgi:DDE family transposase